MNRPTLVLIRHAQSANNALPEHLRVPDPALTPLGQRQAAALAERLATWELTHLYCSPFLRSMQTMAAITARSRLVPTVLPDLCEQGGCYEGHLPQALSPFPGMKRQEILQHFPGWQLSSEINDGGWWFEKAYEDHSAAIRRARRVVEWITDHIVPGGGMHAMVIHADFKSRLLEQLLNSDDYDSQSEPYNVSVTRLDWTDDKWLLSQYNCIEHLSDEIRS